MKTPIVYEEVKCPACGKLVISHPATDYMYGCPVRNCPWCKEEYFDPFVHELAADGYRTNPKIIKKLIRDEIACLIFTVVLAILNLIAVALESTSFILIALMVFSLLLGIYKINIFFVNRKHDKKGLEKETKESEERLSDSAYAKKLKEHGVNVPEKYLGGN